MTGSLLGDKSHTALFDNSKIKRFVPGYVATMKFRQAIARTIAWYDADPARKVIDTESVATWERLINAYDRGLAAAVAEFAKKPGDAG